MFPRSSTRPSPEKAHERPSPHRDALAAGDDAIAVLGFRTLQSLDERFAAFLDHARYALGHSPDSCRGYRGVYANFRAFLASPPATPLSRRLCDIEGWTAWNRARARKDGKPLSGATIHTYFRHLQPFFRDLEAREGLPSPFRGLKPPRLPRSLPKARSFAECQQVLASAEHRTWPDTFQRWRAVALIGTMLYAGLRKGEVLRVRAGDVDLQAGTIFVTEGKWHAERVVTIAPELHAIYRRYLSERHVAFGGNAGPAFFTSTSTGQGISEATLRRIMAAIRRAAGVPFSMHSLRHSFLTTLLTRGVPIHVAQQLAGHARITTTALYLGVTDEDRRREIRKLSFRS